MATIAAFLNKIFKNEGHEGIETPIDVRVDFSLTFRHLTIGTLSLEKGLWSFAYSDEFKKQDRIKPLSDFPDMTKRYEFDHLHPFFLQRIPSLEQPKVRAVIKAENLDPTDEVQLLKRFGRRTIANPYHLQTL